MPQHRMMLAGGLATAVAAAAVVVSLTFANDSAAAEPGTGTQRVSVDSAGKQGGEQSNQPAISADGRYVAFSTLEPFSTVDLMDPSPSKAGGNDERFPDLDIYVRDTQLGTTTLITHNGKSATAPSWGDSDHPTISGNGRFIAFSTNSKNIVDNPYGVDVIVLCDRDAANTGTLGDCAYSKI